MLDASFRNLIAVKSEDDWNIGSCHTESDYCDKLSKADSVDMSCLDITPAKAVSAAEAFRRENPNAPLVLVTDLTVSPTTYMKPSIMACSLLLRPVSSENVTKCLDEVINIYLCNSDDTREDDSSRFCVQAKDGNTYYPYDKLIFFEAREKKVFLNTMNGEVGFYSTLDALGAELPSYFVRCHRGFIINARKVERISLTDNIVFLVGDTIVPLSRGYKPEVKKALGKLMNE